MEIKSLSMICESYKIDRGHHPNSPATRALSTKTELDPQAYREASRYLYRALSGDADGDPKTASPEDGKNYLIEIPRSWLSNRGESKDTYFVDDWGNCIGYSTREAALRDGTGRYNPTFDLWSVGKPGSKSPIWIKNW